MGDHKIKHEDNHETKINFENDSEDDKIHEKPSDPVRFIFMNINFLPKSQQFAVLTIGVFLFYLIYGYFQELLFKLDGFRPFGWYLTLIQFGYYTGFGFIELLLTNNPLRKIPLINYFFLAFLTVATMGLSNSSLGYLNYPTQVIFKCCKLIPVLIGGIFIQGKRYTSIDFISCLCMSIGLIFFTLADNSVSPNFSVYGIVLISLALVADAVIGNVQEKTMKKYSSSNAEMVLYSYSIGFLYILLGQLASGNFWDGYAFCLRFPIQTYVYALVFSLTGYLGLNIVLTMVKSFGALIAVTVTTCRKAITIILSFMFFTKPFTMQYIWSGLIVVLGIYLNVYSKNKSSWDLAFKNAYHKYIKSRRKFDHTSDSIV